MPHPPPPASGRTRHRPAPAEALRASAPQPYPGRRDVSSARGGTVRSVTRAVAVLRAFEHGSRLELREIAHAAGLDRGTTRRLLMTLMADGLVIQYAPTGQYSLGPELRRLAGYVVDVDLRQVFGPQLEALAAELGMTAFLSAWRNHAAVCLERHHDLHGLQVRWWDVGGAMPANCGAAPKLLLAYQSEAEIERVLAGELVPLTRRSIVSRPALRRRLALIRKRGWELAIDDVATGLTALAVPALDESGAIIAAVSITGLTSQMVRAGKPLHLDRLRRVVGSVLQPATPPGRVGAPAAARGAGTLAGVA